MIMYTYIHIYMIMYTYIHVYKYMYIKIHAHIVNVYKYTYRYECMVTKHTKGPFIDPVCGFPTDNETIDSFILK
jgi:hypothetical protein